LFFSDIVNFTSIAEGMDSDQLAHLMNAYFEAAVSRCIHKTDGTVVKYIGDAIFALWNAPEFQSDHAVRACEAALHFRELGSHQVDGKELRTRIGLHTGLANVGNFGSAERVDYTALGENVNLASRLEGLNKFLGTVCLLSGDTKQLVGDRLITRLAGRFRLKGFEKAVEVYELIGWPGQEGDSRAWRDCFAEALLAFQRGNLDAAEKGFRRTLELHPDDGPSGLYLSRLAELRGGTLPPGWNGEIELKEK
jgi:adenylate cyclase